MKTRHGLLLGFAVLLVTAIFFLTGCPTDDSGGGTGTDIDNNDGTGGTDTGGTGTDTGGTGTGTGGTGTDTGGTGTDTGGTGNVAVSSVSLSQTTLKIVNGGDGTTYVTISPSNATNQKVTWSSSDSSVASVAATTHQLTGQAGGKITAKKPGTATITVKTSDGNKTATCSVTVVPAAPSNVSATASAGTISVTWSAVTGAASYKVYYVGAGSDLVLLGTSTTGSYASSGWTGTGTVYIKVTAVGGGQEGGYTAGATVNISNGSGNPTKQ